MRSLGIWMVVTAVFTLTACGSSTPAPTAPPAIAGESAGNAPPAQPAASAAAAGAESTSAPEGAAHHVWSDDFSKDQAVAFMKKNVVPEMEPVFKAYDAKRYAEFGCKTCHGSKFKEPKDHLPKLTVENGQITAFSEEPEIAKFMAEQVVPHMAAAMGLKPFDPATHTGFGCNGCHTVQMK